MTEYSPDNPFAQGLQKTYSADNPFATKDDGGAFRFIDDLIRSVASGATFGFADEFAAGMNSLLGESYDENLAYQRQRDQQFREEDPAWAMGAEIAGSLPTILAAPLSVPATASNIARVAGGAGAGGLAGAAYGFGSGEGGMEGRIGNAVIPAAFGGLLGGAAPVVAKGAGKLLERTIRRNNASRQGVEPETVDVLREIMASDQRGMGARFAQAGDDAMMADAGPNTQALLDMAVQRSGPAGVTARHAIDDRVTTAAGRMQSALDETLGRPQGVKTIEENLRSSTRTPVSAAYDAAYASPIDYSGAVGREIEQLINSRVPARAIKEANELMRLSGDPQSQQVIVRIAEDGTRTFETLPDVRQLDYITRGLNQLADREAGKGAIGSTTQRGRALTNLSGELRGLMREAVPEYAEALGMAATPIQARKALQLGRGAFGRMTRDDLADGMRGMTDMERRYVAQGVREAIDDEMAKVRTAFTDPNMDAREAAKALKLMSGRSEREKVRMVIGDDAAKQLFEEFDRAAAAFGLKASVAQNSKTFARQSLEDRINQTVMEGPRNLLMRGQPVAASRSLAAELAGGGNAASQARADRVYSGLVDALVRPASLDRARQMATMPSPTGAGARADALLAPLLARIGLPALPPLSRPNNQ